MCRYAQYHSRYLSHWSARLGHVLCSLLGNFSLTLTNTMMDTEKILHLRRYVTLLQTGVRLHVARSHLHTRGTVNSPCGGGYVHRYMQRSSAQAHLRFKNNYATTYARTFSTSIAQPSVDDVDQRLMLLSNDVKKGQVMVDELKEVLKLCEDSTHRNTSLLLLKCCGNLSTDLDISARQNLIDQVKQSLCILYVCAYACPRNVCRCKREQEQKRKLY